MEIKARALILLLEEESLCPGERPQPRKRLCVVDVGPNDGTPTPLSASAQHLDNAIKQGLAWLLAELDHHQWGREAHPERTEIAIQRHATRIAGSP